MTGMRMVSISKQIMMIIEARFCYSLLRLNPVIDNIGAVNSYRPKLNKKMTKDIIMK